MGRVSTSIPMRTRTRVTPKQVHLEDSRCPNYPNGSNVLRTFTDSDYLPQVNESGSTETIIDDPTPGLREKYVKHTRYSVEDRPPQRHKLGFSRFHPLSAGYRPDNDWLYDTNVYHVMLLKYGSHWRSLWPMDATQLPELKDVPISVQHDAFEFMMPKVNDGLSIVNFILELSDLRRMFDFKTLERELRNAYRKYGQLSKYLSQKKEKRSQWAELRNAANDLLNYSFGWKPFLGDLIKMYKALNGLDKKLDYLERNQGRAIVRHYSKDLDVADLPCSVPTIITTVDMYYLFYTGGPWSQFGTNARIMRKDSYDYRPRYHATINYTYTLPKYGPWSSIRRTIRGYLDAFGVRLDPSIIWNAIPFSFVVDWVIDVGGWLRQFTPNDLGMEVVIHDASHSVKYQQVSQITASLPVLAPENYPNPQTVSHYTEAFEVSDVVRTYYERDRWNPSVFAAGVSFPSLMQWTLGGALGIAKDRSRYKRG